MGKKDKNQGFICDQCGRSVLPMTNGSYRNHCPFCLYSRHLDYLPGDRGCMCGGLMRPVGIAYHRNKGYQIIHQCSRCGVQNRNKVARDTIQPDNIDEVIKLM
jgi:ribosomal protein L37E